MKPSSLFKLYIWIINTIYSKRYITLQELNERWIQTHMSGGIPMNRVTFNRHRQAIEEMLDVSIQCQRRGGYYYYIENDSVFTKNNLQHWLLDSLSISNMLMESSSLKDRILLENIPVGKEFLHTIIDAMKRSCKLKMAYRKFGQVVGYTITIEPYAIKVFKQRWYLLANDERHNRPTVYALDRIERLEETEETFVLPSDFNAEMFFKDCYGVICGSEKEPQRIVIRAYQPCANYMRTLPLHHSQKIVGNTADYTDFEFHLCPTFDFRQELLSQAHEVEVLEPAEFREEMKKELLKALRRYE